MAELRIPYDLKERYDRCCNPDDEAYSAWECTLIERIAKLEAPVSDEENEEYSNHTYVYGFRDALEEFRSARAKGEAK